MEQSMLKKSKFYFFVGAICIVGGFYVDNLDSGRLLLELLGLISILMGVLNYKKLKKVTFAFLAVTLLLCFLILDYGVSKMLKKAPIFALEQKGPAMTTYQGLFYQAWRCGDTNTNVVYGNHNSEYQCDLSEKGRLQEENKALQKELADLKNQATVEPEKNPCTLTRTYTVEKKLGLADETGTKEYVVFRVFQSDPILGQVAKSELNRLVEGNTYELTFIGTHEVGAVSHDVLFREFQLNIITETPKEGLEQIQESVCK